MVESVPPSLLVDVRDDELLGSGAIASRVVCALHYRLAPHWVAWANEIAQGSSVYFKGWCNTLHVTPIIDQHIGQWEVPAAYDQESVDQLYEHDSVNGSSSQSISQTDNLHLSERNEPINPSTNQSIMSQTEHIHVSDQNQSINLSNHQSISQTTNQSTQLSDFIEDNTLNLYKYELIDGDNNNRLAYKHLEEGDMPVFSASVYSDQIFIQAVKRPRAAPTCSLCKSIGLSGINHTKRAITNCPARLQMQTESARSQMQTD